MSRIQFSTWDRKRMARSTVVLLATLFLMALAIPTMAQEVIDDDQVNEIAKEVYCPVCESTPLDVCETLACADWRELIRTKLSEGQTKEEIFAYFANQYGDRVLASPPKKGFNLILWVGPIVAIAVGLFFFSRYLQVLKASNQQEAPTSTAGPVVEQTLPAADDYTARIEQELAKK